jgi:Fe-S-cluster containining protein
MTIINKGNFLWHNKVPRKFECQLGCSCCCLNTFFFPSEEKALPDEIRKYLRIENGRICPKIKNIKDQRRCVFFDLSTPNHCLIHELRPLRCQIYPYLPIISNGKIIVIAEPFLDLNQTGFGVSIKTPDWVICYGLNAGSDIKKEIEGRISLFLKKIASEFPEYIERLSINNIENKLNVNEIDKHLKPKYGYYYEYGPINSYPNLELVNRIRKLDNEAIKYS